MRSPADMRVIQIEITNACPKRCSNCTRFCGHHTEPFYMDFETFKQAVDSMKGFKGIVGFMGGEPTIHPEFEKFVRYYRENIGYDDFSTACYEPTSNFVNHILANAYHTGFSNQRRLWTSVGPKYYEHFELIQDTFGYQLVSDHSNPSNSSTGSSREASDPWTSRAKAGGVPARLVVRFATEKCGFVGPALNAENGDEDD